MKKLYAISAVLLMSVGIKAQTEVTFFTSKGRFVVEIYDNIVPITGQNFLDLVDQKFYDGVIFHRVINNFMIQGGDPTGTGSGGPGYTIQDEFDPSLSNVQKTISMANSGPNTGGSQFFINLVDNTYLDYDKAPLTSKHPVFGITTQNFNIVQDIGLVPTNGQDRPITDVVMDSIRRGGDVFVGLDKVQSYAFKAKIYPNPGNENSLLEIQSGLSDKVKVQIYDAQGRRMVEREIQIVEGRNFIPFKEITQNLTSPGIYHVQLSQENNSQQLRLFVK